MNMRVTIDSSLYPSTRREARERGIKSYFTGAACVHGHVSLRRTICGTCAECHGARSKALYARKRTERNAKRRLARALAETKPERRAVHAVPPPSLAFIPIGQRRTLLELTEATCRWPVGDPGEDGFYFCGGCVQEGSVYCGSHHREAYQRRDATRPRAWAMGIA